MSDDVTGPTRSQFRPEIQGLRALAVAAVVIYHLSPTRLTGGFVGVDVFFVVSGFLITAHLVAEGDRTGTLRLRDFYARRIRRLLPAALVVLAATTILTFLVVPMAARMATFAQIIASAFYVQNWALAAGSTDYLASETAPTIVRHFWTLSVEEQFYLVWPVLILTVILLARRRGAAARTRGLATLFVVAFALSLAWSILQTDADASLAFFSTPARIWEFAAGAILALVTLRSDVLDRIPGRVRIWISWGGLGLLAVSFARFDASTGIPGYAALLPVLGTIAVIAAGSPQSPWSPTALATFGPVNYLGSISYSVYLWHWPLVVLYPVVTGRGIGITTAVVIVAATLMLAALTTWLVENPARRSPILAAPPWRSIAFAATGMSLMLAIGALGLVTTQRDLDASATEAAAQAAYLAECGGAAAIDHVAECGDPYRVTEDIHVAAVAALGHPVLSNTCEGGAQFAVILDGFECVYGNPESDFTLALLGDSHAAQWMPAIEKLADENDWRIITLIRHSCTFSPSTLIAEGSPWAPCNNWKKEAIRRVEMLRPDVAIVLNLNTAGYTALDHSFGTHDEQVAGFTEYFTRMQNVGTKVVVIRDDPYMKDMVSECLGNGTQADAERCSSPRSTALDTVGDPAYDAAVATTGVSALDFSRYYCDEATCYSVIGNTLVFRDHGHLSVPYITSLTPMLRSALVESGVSLAEIPAAP
jgi:peptidoglycan/LPS O-acetylase OafA/YrhL